MVTLSKSERRVLCIEFARYVPKIREILHMTQHQFGAMCGISIDRLSRIENQHAVMTWSQLTSILFACMMNIDTKEYLFANAIIPQKIFQYFQQKEENIPPLININVHEEIIKNYLDKNRSDSNGNY